MEAEEEDIQYQSKIKSGPVIKRQNSNSKVCPQKEDFWFHPQKRLMHLDIEHILFNVSASVKEWHALNKA